MGASCSNSRSNKDQDPSSSKSFLSSLFRRASGKTCEPVAPGTQTYPDEHDDPPLYLPLLPTGWTELVNSASAKSYYYNGKGGTTCSERPKPDAPGEARAGQTVRDDPLLYDVDVDGQPPGCKDISISSEDSDESFQGTKTLPDNNDNKQDVQEKDKSESCHKADSSVTHLVANVEGAGVGLGDNTEAATVTDLVPTSTVVGEEVATTSTEKTKNTPSFHDLVPFDEMARAKEFAGSTDGLFTSKWILKNMPGVAKLLRDGTVCFLDIRDYVCSEKEHPAELLPFIRDVRSISSAAIPRRFRQYSGCGEDGYLDAREAFYRNLEEHLLNLEAESQCENTTKAWLSLYKAATDQACETVASYLDSCLFRGKRGTFLRKCPLYRKPERFYSQLLGGRRRKWGMARKRQEFRNKIIQNTTRFGTAVEAVMEEIHCEHKTCWECGKIGAARQCSSCNVAVFCSERCHTIMWQHSHKHTCAKIKLKRDRFHASLALVTAKHDSDLQENLTPSYAQDFFAFDLYHCGIVSMDPWQGSDTEGDLSDPWKGTEFDGVLSVASMECYFDNLQQIRNGVFWFFSGQESLGDYRKRICGKSGLDGREMHSFQVLLTMTCFDYFGYLNQRWVP